MLLVLCIKTSQPYCHGKNPGMLACWFGKAISEILCGVDRLSPGYGWLPLLSLPNHPQIRFFIPGSAKNISARYELILHFGNSFLSKKLSMNL